MRVPEIIDKLCNHEISKREALHELEKILNNEALQFTVEEFSYTVGKQHATLKIVLPYQYYKVQDKIKKGDNVNVFLLNS